MKGDQMGIRAAYPTPRELPLSNRTRFSCGTLRVEAEIAGQPTGVSSVGEGAGPTVELARLQRAAAQKALEVTGLGLPRDHPVCDLADRIALRAVAGEHQLAVEVEDHHGFRPCLMDGGDGAVDRSRDCFTTCESGLATGRVCGRVTVWMRDVLGASDHLKGFGQSARIE